MKATKKTQRIASASQALEQNALDRELRQCIEAQASPSGRNGRMPTIRVEVKSGFVVLRGFVRTYREKERLHRFVMGLRGVRALKDLMRVQPIETLADRQVALHVRQALDAHSELPPGTATVQVHGGACHLQGHVRSAEERHIAETVSSHCRGVKSVVNELTVDPLDEISDAATARAVKSALAYCMDTDTESVTVSCIDGKIILRGQVATMMDRNLAEEVTRIQFGVRTVENHIQVEGHRSLDPVTVADNARRAVSRRTDLAQVRKGSARTR